DTPSGLVDVGGLDRLTDGDLALVGGLLTHDHLEQRRLTDTVRSDDTDDAVRRQGEAQVLDEDTLTEPLGEVLDLDDGVAQARARRNLDLLEVQLASLVRLGRHLLVTFQPGLGLGLTGPGVGTDPLQLLLDPAGTFG